MLGGIIEKFMPNAASWWQPRRSTDATMEVATPTGFEEFKKASDTHASYCATGFTAAQDHNSGQRGNDNNAAHMLSTSFDVLQS